MKLGLSVVIPAYNEEKNISKCISDVYQVLKKTD
jgi:glycosyltransferase involved in cell wall biosynthesis